MKTMTRTLIPLLGIVALAAVDLPAQTETKPGERLELTGYEVYRIELARPYTVTDEQGTTTTFREAFLVRLEVPHPGFWGEKVDFFVGDYRVPEYGSWPKGIYFKVYDPDRFAALGGGELRYRIGDGEIRSFGRRFEVDERQPIVRALERELIPGAATAQPPG